jgi:hypothetical protein
MNEYDPLTGSSDGRPAIKSSTEGSSGDPLASAEPAVGDPPASTEPAAGDPLVSADPVVGDPSAFAEPESGDPASTEESSDDRPAESPPARPVRTRPRPIRRVPNPRMSGLLDSPVRNLRYGALYTIAISLIGIAAYMSVGWNFRDALYMVITTVYTVGYGEVRPINTPALNVITLGLILLGCTGVIFLTGALVQFFALSQFNKVDRTKAHANANRSAQRTCRRLRLWRPRRRAGAVAEGEQRRIRRHRSGRSARHRGARCKVISASTATRPARKSCTPLA